MAFRELIYQLFRENELEMSSIQKMIPQIDIVHLRRDSDGGKREKQLLSE